MMDFHPLHRMWEQGHFCACSKAGQHHFWPNSPKMTELVRPFVSIFLLSFHVYRCEQEQSVSVSAFFVSVSWQKRQQPVCKKWYAPCFSAPIALVLSCRKANGIGSWMLFCVRFALSGWAQQTHIMNINNLLYKWMLEPTDGKLKLTIIDKQQLPNKP